MAKPETLEVAVFGVLEALLERWEAAPFEKQEAAPFEKQEAALVEALEQLAIKQ